MTPSEKITQLIRDKKIANMVIGEYKDREGIYIDFCRSEEDGEIAASEDFKTLDEALEWVWNTYQEMESNQNLYIGENK